MTKFLFVRHGKTNYSEVDKKGFIGQGRDLAALTELGIKQLNETAENKLLENSNLIISSPYTRALQSAAILSRKLDIDIKVEVDLHEWIPDIINYQHKSSEDCFELAKDYELHNGIHPKDEEKVWESKESVKKRVDTVLKKYLKYKKVIVVCHGMIMQIHSNKEEIRNGEIVEFLMD